MHFFLHLVSYNPVFISISIIRAVSEMSFNQPRIIIFIYINITYIALIFIIICEVCACITRKSTSHIPFPFLSIPPKKTFSRDKIDRHA